MFSLKTTALKVSRLGSALHFTVLLCCVVLLNHLGMPTSWRYAYLSVALGALIIIVARHLQGSRQSVGIDELGCYLCQANQRYPLTFVRFNSFQLIARYPRENALLDKLWPSYCVIYKDSVDLQCYGILRAFAARQKLLNGKGAS